jgi:hypothetical protein
LLFAAIDLLSRVVLRGAADSSSIDGSARRSNKGSLAPRRNNGSASGISHRGCAHHGRQRGRFEPIRKISASDEQATPKQNAPAITAKAARGSTAAAELFKDLLKIFGRAVQRDIVNAATPPTPQLEFVASAAPAIPAARAEIVHRV